MKFDSIKKYLVNSGKNITLLKIYCEGMSPQSMANYMNIYNLINEEGEFDSRDYFMFMDIANRTVEIYYIGLAYSQVLMQKHVLASSFSLKSDVHVIKTIEVWRFMSELETRINFITLMRTKTVDFVSEVVS